MKYRIRSWIIYNLENLSEPPYYFDATKLDVSDEEISMNIQEQISRTNIWKR